MNMVAQIAKAFQKTLELSLSFLEEKMSFPELEEKLQKVVNGMGKDILEVILQAKDEEIKKDSRRRSTWEIVRQNDSRTILTPFGDINYKRSYYRNKTTGEYLHLLDTYTGFRKRKRIDPLLEALILENATECSYQKAGREILPQGEDLTVSPEVVKRLVHHSPRNQSTPTPGRRKKQVKKVCSYLFIEADEDHVSFQEKRSLRKNRRGKRTRKTLLAKLVYIHEGKKTPNAERTTLKNPHYFAGLYEDTENLWYEVLTYLEEHYDLEEVKHIFLCGDGASWIKKGLAILPKSIFILDRFHLQKRIQEGIGHCPSLLVPLYRALREGDGEKVREILCHAFSQSENPREQKRLQDLSVYLFHNWEGIKNQKYSQGLGLDIAVSAEAHVSHVLSARLSQRPMGWGKKGADRMSYLRAMKFNGYSIKRFYLQTHREHLPPFTLSAETVRREKEKGRKVFQELYRNIPVFQGPSSELRLILKALTQDLSWVPVI